MTKLYLLFLSRYGLFVPRSVKKTETVKASNIFGDAESDEEQVIVRIYRVKNLPMQYTTLDFNCKN